MKATLKEGVVIITNQKVMRLDRIAISVVRNTL